MHTHSRTWISPVIRTSQSRQRLNGHRRRFCPDSPFWTVDFDIQAHRDDFAAEARQIVTRGAQREKDEEERRSRLELPPAPAIKPAFRGKRYLTSYSTVLCLPTSFVPEDLVAPRVSIPWPDRTEMKYEGDDRIATETIHGRFLPALRIHGNNTVNWMQRRIVQPEHLDQFWPVLNQFCDPRDNSRYPAPSPEDIFLRAFRVEDLEVDDDIGQEILGRELMEELERTGFHI